MNADDIDAMSKEERVRLVRQLLGGSGDEPVEVTMGSGEQQMHAHEEHQHEQQLPEGVHPVDPEMVIQALSGQLSQKSIELAMHQVRLAQVEAELAAAKQQMQRLTSRFPSPVEDVPVPDNASKKAPKGKRSA